MARAFDEREREILRAALLDQAARLIRQQGIQGTTVDDLTRGVQIAKGSFYSFFPTREALFWALMKREEAQMAAAIEQTARGAGDVATRARAIFTDHFLDRDSIVHRLSQRDMEYITRKLPEDLLDADRAHGTDIIATILSSLGISVTDEHSALFGSMLQALRLVATDEQMPATSRDEVLTMLVDTFATRTEAMGHVEA